MIKKPNIKDPTEFGDVFTILLIYISMNIVLSEFVENEFQQSFLIITLVILLGWVLYAINNILKKHSEKPEEDTL